MSTGSEMSNAFRKGTKNEQDIQDHQVPQSVILYLLQEATKLASPPKQDCLESRALNGIWSGEQNEWHKQCSDSARYASTSHFNSYCQLDSEPQKSYTGSFSVMRSQPSSSPWEVMSLINLQCERLLCPVDGKDVEMNSVAAAPAFEDRGFSFKKSKSTGHSGELSGFMEGNTSHAVPQHGKKAKRDFEALRPCSRGDQAGFVEEGGGDSAVIVSPQCSINMLEDTLALSQTPAMTDVGNSSVNAYRNDKKHSGLVQLADTKAGDTCYLRNISSESKENEDCLQGGEILTLPSSEGKEKCLSSKRCEPLSEPSLNLLASLVHQKSQQLGCSVTTKDEKIVSSSSDVKASRISDQHVKVDYNLNVIPSFESSEDVQPLCCPQALPHKSNSDPNTGTSKPAPNEGTSALPPESCGSSVGNMGEQQAQLRPAHPASDVKGQGRTPRKQSHPTRSADLGDPDFQGVTFHMHAELNDSRDQCRLLITSNYSAELLKGRRRERRSRRRSLVSCLKSSSSEEESDCSGLSKNKVCASCNTKKTPLWRDAEDGTPLCNACGIRYKKYRVRCFQCWNIPRKESNSNLKCHKCGDALRLATSHRKLTSW